MITQGQTVTGFGFVAAIEAYCIANDIVFLNGLLPAANMYNTTKEENLLQDQYILIVAIEMSTTPKNSNLDKLNYSGSLGFAQKFTNTDSCDISEQYQEKYALRYSELMQQLWNIIRDWQNMTCSKEFPRFDVTNFSSAFLINKTDAVIDMIQCDFNFIVDAY